MGARKNFCKGGIGQTQEKSYHIVKGALIRRKKPPTWKKALISRNKPHPQRKFFVKGGGGELLLLLPPLHALNCGFST